MTAIDPDALKERVIRARKVAAHTLTAVTRRKLDRLVAAHDEYLSSASVVADDK